MISIGFVIAITAFLAGAATTLFFTMVIGIRRNDRPGRRRHHRSTRLDSFTSTMLGARTWENELPARHDPGPGHG
jgi:hypothetical protein